MENIDRVGKHIKSVLKMNGTLLENIPNVYFYTAMLSRDESRKLPATMRRYLIQETGYSDYETFEFVGDAVYELVMAEIIYRNPILNMTSKNIVGNHARSNHLFSCLMQSKNLCSLTMPQKECADKFEAIVGVVYTALEAGNYDSVSIIGQWLTSVWDLEQAYTSRTNTCDHLVKGNGTTLPKHEIDQFF
ncbi:ribonuclease III [compost metagenome]